LFCEGFIITRLCQIAVEVPYIYTGSGSTLVSAEPSSRTLEQYARKLIGLVERVTKNMLRGQKLVM
jgi:hypothetical protein